ncbi:MAG: DUF6273 domain-containing protein [Oscillospiraceae bacterium]|nr:DUF6273 domain-containing protein [Oscillospiraceae bacterium]
MSDEASVNVGDIIPFGGYDWLVLAVRDGKVLLISRDILEKRRFDGSGNIWAGSELYKYLNGELFSGFSDGDKSRVYHSSEGNVFLLSVDEARKYFEDDENRMAVCNGEFSWWWLRSPAFDSDLAAYVYVDGSVCIYGYRINVDSGGVRPAMWVNL